MAAKNTKYLIRGKGKHLEISAAPIPSNLDSTEIVIRLQAIAINPADCKTIDHGHRVTTWPIVPGLDGAGVVEAVGSEVKRFTVGDEVVAMFSASDRGGSFQNFAVVPEMMVAKKPSMWTFEDAATLT
jgi:NADPH:quinone reductase-like Zn-dependent oxidoreductase